MDPSYDLSKNFYSSDETFSNPTNNQMFCNPAADHHNLLFELFRLPLTTDSMTTLASNLGDLNASSNALLNNDPLELQQQAWGTTFDALYESQPAFNVYNEAWESLTSGQRSITPVALHQTTSAASVSLQLDPNVKHSAEQQQFIKLIDAQQQQYPTSFHGIGTVSIGQQLTCWKQQSPASSLIPSETPVRANDQPFCAQKSAPVSSRTRTAKKCTELKLSIALENSKPNTSNNMKKTKKLAAGKAPRCFQTTVAPVLPVPEKLSYVPTLLKKLKMDRFTVRESVSAEPSRQEFGIRIAEVYQPLYDLIYNGDLAHKQAMDILAFIYPVWAPRFTIHFRTKIYRGKTLKKFIKRKEMPSNRSKRSESESEYQTFKKNPDLRPKIERYLTAHPEACAPDLERIFTLSHGTAYRCLDQFYKKQQ